MATNVRAKIQVQVTNESYVTTVNGTTVTVPATALVGKQLVENSTGVDAPYRTTGTLAFGATVDIDLNAAGISTTVFAVVVKLTTTTGSLKVGGSGGANVNQLWFNDVTDAVLLEQGGPPFAQGSAAGKVIDATHKTFRITNTHGSESATYEVRAWGEA